jgi:hypothetical protein
MKILINDIIQFSDLPDELKSPSLADRYLNTGTLTINFTVPEDYSTFNIYDGVLSQPYFYDYDGVLSQPMYNTIDGVLSQPLSVSGSNEFNCIGIGGTDATQLTINGTITINSTDGRAFKDGLYEISQSITASTMTIDHNGTYMGRIAVGECRAICISPSREPGFYSSVKPRETLSGQVIPSAGGYGGGLIGVDFRYKIDRDIIEDFRRAYVTQTMQGFPFFLDFDNDNWLPFNKFYGKTSNKIIFQSSINSFKYSKRFEFKQAF